jgi:hypothetical protein
MPRTRDTGYISAYPVIVAYGEVYGVATGGTSSSITVGGQNYTLLTFTSDGTLTVTQAGLFDVLMFGGGGAGYAYSQGGGGGGAGGIFQQTIYLDSNQTVDVGAGGAAANNSGFASSIGTRPSAISAVGGGVGYSFSIEGAYMGCSAGSSGGFSNSPPTSASNIQGFRGGTSSSSLNGGGGGGTTSEGSAGTGTTGGAGGAGYDVSVFIGGSALLKGAGGGGGASVTGGAGGSSIGGNGQGGSSGLTTPAANTASGGGGRGDVNASAGGSGIIYVRFKV